MPEIPLMDPNDPINTPLNEKEQRIIGKLDNTPGLILVHGTGTGKTRSSIQVAKALNSPTEVVLPPALRSNYEKELMRWRGRIPNDLNIVSQAKLALGDNSADGQLGPNKTLIVDESQKMKTPGSNILEALKHIQARKKLLLSATPINNHPGEIAPLINLAAGKNVLPEDKTEFFNRFVSQKPVSPGLFAGFLGARPGTVPSLKEDPALTNAIKRYVDYQPGSNVGFPGLKEEVVKVPLTQQQQQLYKGMMGQLPFWLRYKVKRGLPPNKQELEKLRAFMTGPRQVANSTYGYATAERDLVAPKVEKAFNYLKEQLATNPNYKGVVYSNFVRSGLTPYKDLLTKHQIPFGEFTGQISKSLRDKMIRDYNANKLRALLISPAGAEGLDLKGTRLLQILEPHFNLEKEKQVIGRGRRYMSHAALPPQEQNMLVQRYLSEPQTSIIDKLMGVGQTQGVDEYIRRMALQKDQLNQQLMNMIAKHGQ